MLIHLRQIIDYAQITRRMKDLWHCDKLFSPAPSR
jgi:hypothetical protein